MSQRHFPLALILAIVAWTHESPADEIPNGPGAFASRAIVPINDRELAEAIDQALSARWSKEKVEPAPLSGDAEFLRRVSLDIAGRIPPASEARAFLEDNDPQKRRKLVERLLAGQAYANHMTDVWLDLLLPEAKSSPQIAFYAGDFQVWLRRQFSDGVGYDAIVRELLTSPMANLQNMLNRTSAQDIKPSPFAYIAAKEGKPENLAASSSRLFLGIQLECAQCHNHPFAKWKREEFWGLAAFFSGVQRQGSGDGIFQGTDSPAKHEIEMPGSKRLVKAAFLDGRDVDWTQQKPARAKLAEWVTGRDNPYFAQAAANRLWFQYFGVGLVDPVDDMGGGAEASHPELLALLADQFAAHDFDFKYLIRAITSSRAYQLSSAGGSPSSIAYRLFDRMPVRGLTPEQLFDSLIMATGLRREPIPPALAGRSNTLRGEFLERFASQEERPTDRQTSILQALTLMNGRLVDDATSLERGATLPALADSYFLDTKGRIEALYLAVLTRLPTPRELERLVPYVELGGPTLNPRKALADVLWSLLSSAEFVFNH
jgi:Protein of unknown function (DUF1549)/Protein of unknown function (DUF1553)